MAWPSGFLASRGLCCEVLEEGGGVQKCRLTRVGCWRVDLPPLTNHVTLSYHICQCLPCLRFPIAAAPGSLLYGTMVVSCLSLTGAFFYGACVLASNHHGYRREYLSQKGAVQCQGRHLNGGWSCGFHNCSIRCTTLCVLLVLGRWLLSSGRPRLHHMSFARAACSFS